MATADANDQPAREAADTRPEAADTRPPVAWRPLLAVAAAVTAVLVLGSRGYGYHRDEYYFVAAGHHPAFGYVDQPPLVPLLARALDAFAPGDLTVLRLPSALAAGVVVLVTGLLARELGGGRAAQVLAAVCLGVSAALLTAGHLLHTTILDITAWTVLTWLVLAFARRDSPRWLWVGAVAGVALEVKSLVLVLLGALVVGLLAVGPRRVLTYRWVWAAAGLAVVLWAPNLVWQATNGWPQLTLGRSIAAGGSGTSDSLGEYLLLQLVLVSPLLVPVWVAGLVRLLRAPLRARAGFLAVAYLVLLVGLAAARGKGYYLVGMYPALVAAGATPAVTWATRLARHAGGTRIRPARLATLAVACVLSLAVSVVLALPVVPADRLAATPVTDVDYDAGETVGWLPFVRTVGGAFDRLDPADHAHAVILTENYGEAGALEHHRPDLPVYSGHNAYGGWGPPPATADVAIVVGYPSAVLAGWFDEVRVVGHVDDGVGLDNDEQGATVAQVRGPRGGWAALWPTLRHLG